MDGFADQKIIPKFSAALLLLNIMIHEKITVFDPKADTIRLFGSCTVRYIYLPCGLYLFTGSRPFPV